ncbi:DUF2304 domain-containing protein [Cohnella sp. GCM10020058]|uniref:DUF2304 domain-containing protein n=1 Tax=Cohnella sp. GCM10020058 TaxID=3317330 RepID=UPI00363B0BE7
MKLNLYLLSFLLSASFFVVLIYMIRGRKLREQYALLWLALSAIMMTLSLFPSVIDRMARLIGVAYAPSLLYLLGLVFVLFLLLHLTIAVSAMTRRVIALTQTLALLEQRNVSADNGYAGQPEEARIKLPCHNTQGFADKRHRTDPGGKTT